MSLNRPSKEPNPNVSNILIQIPISNHCVSYSEIKFDNVFISSLQVTLLEEGKDLTLGRGGGEEGAGEAVLI